jgi:hypothetical protein
MFVYIERMKMKKPSDLSPLIAQLVLTAALSLSHLLLIGCNGFTVAAPDAKLVQNAGGPNTDEADDISVQSASLTDEAEDLFGPSSLQEANVKLKQAIELDPTNARAKFWLAMSQPIEGVRGILARVKPFYDTLPDGEERYSILVDHMTANSTAPARRFLLDGPADIKTVSDFQEWEDTMILKMSNLRADLNLIKNEEIQVRSLPAFFNSELENNTKVACSSGKFGPLHVDLGICNSHHQLSLNRADFEVIRESVGGYQAFFILQNAYQINPALVLSVLNRPPGETVNDTQTNKTLQLLVADGFGHLRSREDYKSISGILSDVKVALFYFVQNQDKVCKVGYPSKRNRAGYLVEEGFCNMASKVAQEGVLQRTAVIIETLLLGKPLSGRMINPAFPAEQDFNFNLLTFFQSPPRDLGFIKAVHTDACDQKHAEIDDEALQPYFKGRAASEVFRIPQHTCNETKSSL